MQQALSGSPKEVFVTAGGRQRSVIAEMHERIPGLGVAISIGDEGKMVVPRWLSLGTLFEPGEDWRSFRFTEEHRTLILVESVFHAFRQCWRILYRSGFDTPWSGERATIRRAITDGHNLNIAIVTANRGAPVREMRKRTKPSIEQIAMALGSPRALSKREALNQLEAIEEGTDSTGKINPPAFAARSLKACALLQERYRELCRIDPPVMERQQVFRQMILSAQSTLRSVSKIIQAMRAALENPANEPSADKKLQTLCAVAIQELDDLFYSPYYLMCLHCADDLRIVGHILKRGPSETERGIALAALGRCETAIRIKRLQTEIERALFQLLQYQCRITRRPLLTRIGKKIRVVIRALKGIDDASLTIKCCEQAIGKLERAAGFISTGAGGIKAAYNCLKEASALL